MSSNSSELYSSCRVCLKKDFTLKSLLNTYFDSEWYPDIFLKCTEIKIIDKPEQPSWICANCDKELLRVYKFKTKCIESDEFLSAIFVKTDNVKLEEIEPLECLIKEEETNSDKSFPENDLEGNENSDSEFKEEDEEEENEESESENDDNFKEEKSKKAKKYNKKQEKPLEICKVCNEPLPNTKKGYNLHISIHDPGNPTPFECNLCDKKYKLARQLHLHVKAHDYHIKCSFCDEKFRRPLAKVVHERRIHTFIKPYKCDKCEDMSFFTKTEFNVHNRRLHLTKEFSCDVCKKFFALNSDLTQHKETHNSERDYQCTICGKNFSNSAGVKAHEKQVHSTEERFFCDKCSISFCKKPELWKHNRTVHRFDDAVCDVCGKVFDSSEHLRHHRLYHDEEYKFSCPVCPAKTFARNFLLRRHVKASHPTVEMPPVIRKIGKKSKLWKEEMSRLEQK